MGNCTEIKDSHMIKIKTYKIQPQGIRGKAISLPKVWLDDLNLQPGDTIDFYRDAEDRLILVPEKQGQTS